jgi:transposase, IS5 family
MAIKQTGQASFAESLLPQGFGSNEALDRLAQLVKWYRFEKRLAHLRDEAGPGRPGYPVMILFRALLLQALYGLSDRELEVALIDRLSFKRFVGLSLEDMAPDHTVLNRFRNQLVREGVLDKLFGELDRQLENAGLILKRGTMLDATLIASAAARPTEGRPSLDPDAAFAKRQGKSGSTFGYKAHVGVDEGSGLIRTVIATPANINDTVVADNLIRFDEKAVLADKAYAKAERRQMLRDHGIIDGIMHKSWGGGPALSSWQKRCNRRIARRRGAVETTFATLKCRMRLTHIRYIGLAKAKGQILMAAIAFNMRRWAVIA